MLAQRRVVRIGRDIGRGVDAPGRYRGGIEHAEYVIERVPGRKFSIKMSVVATSLRTMSRASVVFRSSATDFLLRLCEYHHKEVPACSLRQVRSGSPPGESSLAGGSILITSAPDCASSAAAHGPAISEPSSSTWTPARACGFA